MLATLALDNFNIQYVCVCVYVFYKFEFVVKTCKKKVFWTRTLYDTPDLVHVIIHGFKIEKTRNG